MTSDFKPLERLDGRAVLIAGALGAVGQASARRFARLGARVPRKSSARAWASSTSW